MRYDTHNLRVSLENARASMHELWFALQHDVHTVDSSEDKHWKMHELENLAFDYEDRIEAIQRDVDDLITRLEEIEHE